MQVAVWDTYVRSKSGAVLHFDIIVPQEIKDTGAIYRFGVQYLKSIDEPEHDLSVNECQFCHIEDLPRKCSQPFTTKATIYLKWTRYQHL